MATKQQQQQIKKIPNKMKNANASSSNSSSRGKVHGLSHLSESYARSLINPFSSPAACIPDYPVLPSRKLKVFGKGVIETGNAGFGFIQMRPEGGPANDFSPIAYSNSAYLGTTLANTGAGVSTLNSNSDYSSTDFGATNDKARYRVVSAGLRVRYAGTELNRGGLCVGLQHPTHSPLQGMTFQQVDTNPSSKRFRPTDRWISQCYCPVLAAEVGYNTTPISITSGAGGYMGFVFQSPAGATSVTYEFEYNINLEINGNSVRGMTPSAADPSGLAVVHTAAQLDGMRPSDRPTKNQEESFLSKVWRVGEATISSFAHEYISDPAKVQGLLTDVLSVAGSLL